MSVFLSCVDGVCCDWLGLVIAFPRESLSHWLLFEVGDRNAFLRSGWQAIWLTVVHEI